MFILTYLLSFSHLFRHLSYYWKRQQVLNLTRPFFGLYRNRNIKIVPDSSRSRMNPARFLYSLPSFYIVEVYLAYFICVKQDFSRRPYDFPFPAIQLAGRHNSLQD